ncbi:GLPGLI family protein [Psychroflexus gondwanensis]|jgi:GLPGLI family protein|uniref:GLPGLI family protein n=1 Tax=Psychroflexus gondwanensis TaxID=251 RepID=UPI0011BF152A|nr:GLPGLI family protein [Psychroflexus gondwanensis]TXE16962.1 GLPGLI family protein [Psychroflexus gondwanensis]
MVRNINNLLLYVFLLALFFSTTQLYSQETVEVHVRYNFIHQKEKNSVDAEVPFEETVILSVAQKSSRYVAERRYNSINKAKESKSQSSNASNAASTIVVSGGPLLLVNETGTLMREEIMKNFDDDELVLTGGIGFKSYRVTTDIPKIEWEIKTDTKTIGDISCQKAIGKYAGRTYNAWFAPSLPFNDGPWKLSGLPGLILEAVDDKEEVKFIFKELSKNTDKQKEKVISFNQDSSDIPTKLKSYNRLKTAFESDPVGVAKAQFPNVRIGISNPKKNASNLKIKNYNPLELELK